MLPNQHFFLLIILFFRLTENEGKMFPRHSKSMIVLMIVMIALILTSSSFFVSSQSTDVCTSSFHLTEISTTLSNPPPSQTADIAFLTETARHYQLDCLTLKQSFPVTSNRRCATPPSQRLHLCTRPVTTAASSTASSSWTCIDISAYLVTPLTTTVVGSRSGPQLELKITWSTTLSDIECFPRVMTTSVVGLAVPEPGTELGVSIAFVVVVGVVACGALAYGFYALWRISKKFENRDGGNNNAPTATSLDQGLRNNVAKEQYRLALQALGAPQNISSLYDEEGDGDGGDASKVLNMTIVTDDNSVYGGGGENQNRAEDLQGDEEDEEEFEDEEDRQQFYLQRQAWLQSGNDVGGNHQPQRLVLDNNQVVISVAKPLPWYQREQQQQQQQTLQSPPRRNKIAVVQNNPDENNDAPIRTPGVPYRRNNNNVVMSNQPSGHTPNANSVNGTTSPYYQSGRR